MKSYCPISLFCVLLKLLKCLLITRIESLINPQLSPQQAGFHHGQSTTDQVTLLTDDMEEGFESQQQVGVVLVDLTASYDTVWLSGLHLKLLHMLPDQHMVSVMMELLINRSFKLKDWWWPSQPPEMSPNGVPQGFTLTPTLFNIYVSNRPQTTSRQYGYADDLTRLVTDRSWNIVKITSKQDMQYLHDYLQRWRLKLSFTKTITTVFHLNNGDSQYHLTASVDGAILSNNDHPVYLDVTFDRTLTYKKHLEALQQKVNSRNGLLRCLSVSSWGAQTSTLWTGALTLVYSAAEYAPPVCWRSTHTKKLDVALSNTMCIITGCMTPTEKIFLPVLSGIAPPEISHKSCVMSLATAGKENEHHLLHYRLSAATRVQRLRLRWPFSRHAARLLEDDFSPELAWDDCVSNSSPFMHSACPQPSMMLYPGVDLPRM